MSTPVYDFEVKSTGWARCYVTLAPGVSVTTLALDGVDTQCDVMNRHVDKSIQKAIISSRLTTKGLRRLLFDPPALNLPPFTPVWPAAFVSFADGSQTYKATLPPYADGDRWIYGALAIEQGVVVVPQTADGKPHPLIQVVFDVCGFNDSTTVMDVTVQNSRDHIAQSVVTLSALTVMIGVNRVYGPEDHQIYEGQTPIWRGSVGSYLEARIDPPTQMFIDAGLTDPLDPRIEDAVYAPFDATYKPGGFGDLTYSMPSPGGRAELGPRTNCTAQYLVHHGQSQWEHVIKQGELAGSWCGGLRHADGTTTIRLSDDSHYQPKSVNGEYAYYMLQAAHLPSLAAWPLWLTGRRCFARTLKDWAATIAWRIYDDPAQSTKSYSTVDIPYGRRVGGRLCMIGAEFNAEVRGFGRGLLAFIEAAIATPDRETDDKSYFTRLVVEQTSWLDDYALLPGKGHFGVMFSEFDPGDGNGYGAVHPGFASVSWWQQMELLASLRHAARVGFPTTFAAMKGISGSLAAIWNEAPESDYPLASSFYYLRVASVAFASAGIGAHTPLDSWPAISQANYYGAQDSHDVGGPTAGPPYYYLHYLYVLYEAWKFGLAGAEKALAWLKPRAEGQIPATGAYGYLDPRGQAPTPPPGTVPPVVVPPISDASTKVVTATIRGTQKEANLDPKTLTNTLLITLSTPAPPVVVPPAAPGSPQVRVSYDPPTVALAPSEIKKVRAIANNAGPGAATEEVVSLGLPAEVEVIDAGANYDKLTDKWSIGEIPGNTIVSMDVSLRAKA